MNFNRCPFLYLDPEAYYLTKIIINIQNKPILLDTVVSAFRRSINTFQSYM